jgi:hypothetical protein
MSRHATNVVVVIVEVVVVVIIHPTNYSLKCFRHYNYLNLGSLHYFMQEI